MKRSLALGALALSGAACFGSNAAVPPPPAGGAAEPAEVRVDDAARTPASVGTADAIARAARREPRTVTVPPVTGTSTGRETSRERPGARDRDDRAGDDPATVKDEEQDDGPPASPPPDTSSESGRHEGGTPGSIRGD